MKVKVIQFISCNEMVKYFIDSGLIHEWTNKGLNLVNVELLEFSNLSRFTIFKYFLKRRFLKQERKRWTILTEKEYKENEILNWDKLVLQPYIPKDYEFYEEIDYLEIRHKIGDLE